MIELWHTANIVCLSCLHRWVAVYEGEPLKFECVSCGELEGVRDD